MASQVNLKIRREVIKRAQGCCEYCLVSEEDSFFSGEVDHIVSLKHGGETTLDNLAFSCIFCNRNKGTDLGTFLDENTNLVRIFQSENRQLGRALSFGWPRNYTTDDTRKSNRQDISAE